MVRSGLWDHKMWRMICRHTGGSSLSHQLQVRVVKDMETRFESCDQIPSDATYRRMQRQTASERYNSSKYDWCCVSRKASSAAVGDVPSLSTLAFRGCENDGWTMAGIEAAKL